MLDPASLTRTASASRRGGSAPRTLREQEKRGDRGRAGRQPGTGRGTRGAAATLGIPSTTLEAKIVKLGIRKHRFREERSKAGRDTE